MIRQGTEQPSQGSVPFVPPTPNDVATRTSARSCSHHRSADWMDWPKATVIDEAPSQSRRDSVSGTYISSAPFAMDDASPPSWYCRISWRSLYYPPWAAAFRPVERQRELPLMPPWVHGG